MLAAKFRHLPVLALISFATFSSLAGADITSLKDKEVISVYWLGGICQIRYLDFTSKARYERIIKLPHIKNRAACNTNLPMINQYTFKNAGKAATVSANHATKGMEISEEPLVKHNTVPIELFGQPIPGLLDRTMANCDIATAVCEGKLNAVFWDSEGRHIISKHKMRVIREKFNVNDAPISSFDKKLFPSGVVAKDTIIQNIRTTVEWVSGGEYQSDSCSAIWLGDNTLEKPNHTGWGCGQQKSAPSIATYQIIDR